MESLLQDGKLFLGINYWSSRDAIKMWENWDADVVENDFKKISGAGIKILRVFPLWPVFQPLCPMNSNFDTVDYRFKDGLPLPDTEAGRVGVSESACEHFEEFCKLAEKYGLKLMVGLITGHMSFRYFAPPAFEGRNPISDPTVVKWELRFIKYFVKRFLGESSIIGWDLGNECNSFLQRNDKSVADYAYLWCSALSDAIRSIDKERPVITGFELIPIDKLPFNIADIAETADIHSVHSYSIFNHRNDSLMSMRSILDSTCQCVLYRAVGNLPTFTQEIGSIGYTYCSEKSEAMFYRALLFSSWVYNCYGVMWWCAFDQEKMEYAPYDWNTIGSQYGFFRSDGSEKPIVEENRRFAEVMKGLPFEALPEMKSDAVCILPKNTPNPLDLANNTFCLALQANLNLTFVHASQKIPDAKIYIMPSVDPLHAISRNRFNEVIEKVKAGATLYISMGNGLMRELPVITGVEVEFREGYTSTETVTINGKKLRLKADFNYHIESYEGEALAYGEDGRPVYFKHKLGKGYVYFSTIPVEKFLCGQNISFDGKNDYSVWYRQFSDCVKDNHVADVDSTLIRITEHPIDENTRYAVIINYGRDHADKELLIKEGWGIDSIIYGNVKENILSIDGCDAVILKLKKY